MHFSVLRDINDADADDECDFIARTCCGAAAKMVNANSICPQLSSYDDDPFLNILILTFPDCLSINLVV